MKRTYLAQLIYAYSYKLGERWRIRKRRRGGQRCSDVIQRTYGLVHAVIPQREILRESKKMEKMESQIVRVEILTVEDGSYWRKLDESLKHKMKMKREEANGKVEK